MSWSESVSQFCGHSICHLQLGRTQCTFFFSLQNKKSCHSSQRKNKIQTRRSSRVSVSSKGKNPEMWTGIWSFRMGYPGNWFTIHWCFVAFTCSEYRDQGLTRPKVLIVLPFRESALRVVKMLSMLLMSDEQVTKNAACWVVSFYIWRRNSLMLCSIWTYTGISAGWFFASCRGTVHADSRWSLSLFQTPSCFTKRNTTPVHSCILCVVINHVIFCGLNARFTFQSYVENKKRFLKEYSEEEKSTPSETKPGVVSQTFCSTYI